ncbi:MAG: dipeptidase [Lachnospiraceae bacterium]
MRLVDMHCDTIWKLMDLDRCGDLMENQCSVSISGMEEAGTVAQFFACFTNVKDYAGGYDECYGHVFKMIQFMENQVDHYSKKLAFAASYKELMRNIDEEKISVILTVEEGGILNGSLERLDELYRKGVRLMTPIWNYENCFGYPNSRDRSVMQQGLKPFGIEAIQWMGEKGMIVDVSHASDGTFQDILTYAKGPVLASHSNCRELCNHPRNLTDRMLRQLADTGGVAGLNFYGPFLGTANASLVEEMTAHVLHMIQCGGSSLPAIGTDFDGFDGIERFDIPKVENMERLWEALKKKGVSESQLDKIWSGNALRILKGLK